MKITENTPVPPKMANASMPRRILIGSANRGKMEEYRGLLLRARIESISLADLDHPLSDPEETGSTFAENSAIKATYYAVNSGEWTLADDSGLVIDALDGRPGIRSARFGGDVPFTEKMNLLLSELDSRGQGERSARFICAIALADPAGRIIIETEGVVEGSIANSPHGSFGFGYDPIFIPEGWSKTFGEVSQPEKDKVSHRARALAKFLHEMQILWAFDLTNRI